MEFSDELKQELNFPRSLKTFKQMSYHRSIRTCNDTFRSCVGKAKWRVIPPKDFTPDEKKQCETIEQMMHDMEGTWAEFSGMCFQ